MIDNRQTKEALIAILIDEGVLRGRGLLPNGTSTHGRCCTCQDCRHFFDDCVCQHNRVWPAVVAIDNGQPTRDYRSDAEWMATYIIGRLPDLNTMTPDEIADYQEKLEEIVERVADGIGKP